MPCESRARCETIPLSFSKIKTGWGLPYNSNFAFLRFESTTFAKVSNTLEQWSWPKQAMFWAQLGLLRRAARDTDCQSQVSDAAGSS